jgi:hypothetical protein
MKFWMKILKGRNHSEDLGVDGRITLKLTIKKYLLEMWVAFL